MTKQLKLTAAQFEALVQSADEPVIDMDGVNAYLVLDGVEYVTPLGGAA